MGWGTIAVCFVVILHCSLLSAQQVSYCEPYSDRFTLRQEMVGKVGDYYWVSAISKRKVTHRTAITEERDFVVYDQRMNLSTLIQDPPYEASSIKEYLVTTDDYFDRVQLLNADNKEIEVRLSTSNEPVDALSETYDVIILDRRLGAPRGQALSPSDRTVRPVPPAIATAGLPRTIGTVPTPHLAPEPPWGPELRAATTPG